MTATEASGVMATHLADASRKLNYPGVNKLYSHMKANGHRVTFDVVRAFVERQAERQIFSQPRRARQTEGHVTALDIGDRWMADLADLTAQPSSGDGDPPYQYILVVLNVFSKKLWARPLRVKTASTITDAFKEILNGQSPPKRLDTDAGLEFTGPFVKLLQDNQIWHVVKDTADANALAPIDRAIGTLKRAMFRRVVGDKDKDWASNLQTTVDGYNETIHSSLQGRPPEEVEDDLELQFALRRSNAEAMVQNTGVLQARDEKLTKKGAFKVQDPKRPFTRSYQPRYGDAVHEVSRVDNGYVVDTQGNAYKSRQTLAVPIGSSEASNTEQMRGGNAIVERKQKATLEPYQARIANFLGDLGKYEHEVANYMKDIGMEPLMVQGISYRKALRLLGFTVHGNARGSGKQLVTRPAQAAPAADPDVVAAPKRRLIAPAAAAAALAAPPVRRRVMGKQAP